MQPAIRNIVIGLASILALTRSGHAQTLDGRWEGYYSCGAHALRPEWGAFVWQHVNFNVASGQISARRDHINRLKGFDDPMTALFNGRVDENGSVRIDVLSRRQTDASEEFHQTLVGRSVSPSLVELTGVMLTSKGAEVRNCQLTLRLAAPAQVAAPRVAPAPPQVPVVGREDTADAERGRLEAQTAAIKAESQRVAQAARQAADAKRAAQATAQKALDDAKAAEVARRQAEEARGVAQAAQEAAIRKASQDKETALATQQKAREEKEAAEAALARVEESKQKVAEEALVAQEQFPLQEQQFCKVIQKYAGDLKQAERVRNEIRYNQFKKQRKEDFSSLIPDHSFQSWVVYAVEVRQAANGEAAVVLELPCEVVPVLIGSECGDEAHLKGTIREDSPLYREFAKFDNGDSVMVSGDLIGIEEDPPGLPLPSYGSFRPETHCWRNEGAIGQELFVVQLKSVFRLVVPSRQTRG